MIKWATVRLGFLTISALSMLSGGILGFLFGPLFVWYFTGRWNYLRYIRRTYSLIFLGYRMTSLYITDREYRAVFRVKLTDPPMMVPDPALAKISESWQGGQFSCSGCMNCCLKIKCPVLDPATGRCEAYGSVFWRYFNCGRFPENERHIRYYGCEKWRISKS